MEKIKIRLALRKNPNMKSAAYGKYYPEVALRRTLNFRGLVDHMLSHGLAYPRSVVEGALAQITSCLPELVLQGVTVKLDGFGHFYPSIVSKRGGVINQAAILAGIDPLDYIEGLHMRYRPDATKLDNLTGPELKKRASFESYGVFDTVSASGEELDKAVIVPYDQWKVLHKPSQEPEP